MDSENGRYPSRFLAWWLGELRACLPSAISGVLFGAAERLEVALDAGEACFVLRSNGKARELGRGLRPIAHAADGVIEGLVHGGHPFALGVQWHPEMQVADDPLQRRLFAELVRRATR